MFTLIITIAVIAVGVTFALLNSQPVHFDYLFGDHVIPLSLLLVLSLALGVLLGFLVTLPHSLRKRTAIYRLKRQLKQSREAEGP